MYLDGQRSYHRRAFGTTETDEQGRFRVADVPLLLCDQRDPAGIEADLACGVVPFRRPSLHAVEVTLNEVSPKRWNVTMRVDTEPKGP